MEEKVREGEERGEREGGKETHRERKRGKLPKGEERR